MYFDILLVANFLKFCLSKACWLSTICTVWPQLLMQFWKCSLLMRWTVILVSWIMNVCLACQVTVWVNHWCLQGQAGKHLWTYHWPVPKESRCYNSNLQVGSIKILFWLQFVWLSVRSLAGSHNNPQCGFVVRRTQDFCFEIIEGHVHWQIIPLLKLFLMQGYCREVKKWITVVYIMSEVLAILSGMKLACS